MNVQEAVDEHRELLKQQAQLQEELKAVDIRIKYIEEEAIPNMLEAVGTRTWESDTGIKIKVNETPTATCPAASKTDAESIWRRREIFKWLIETKRDGIIKRRLQINLPRDDARGDKLAKDLAAQGFPCLKQHVIEPATLKKFARECAEEGEILPDFFEPDILRKAAIKYPKH